MKVLDIINQIENYHLPAIFSQSTPSDVLRAISKQHINFQDFLVLLSDAAVELLPQIAETARNLTIQRFGKTINFYVPVYLSNECNNQCIYCGFNLKQSINRKTLTIDEIEKEFIQLKKDGFDNVLLLTGESPEKTGIDYLVNAVKKAACYFTFVGLEIYPLSISDYQKLVTAGASGLTIYQETYHFEIYQQMHLKGKKTNYPWRLETPDRAAQAGIRKIGLGALLGLADWRYEISMLALHLNYLRKQYWKTEFTIGFPRIKPAFAKFRIPHPVSDKNFVHILSALRLYFPDIGFILSTRETPALRDKLIELSITQISAGSKTNPGGYSDADCPSGGQFSISDERNLAEMVQMVVHKGYEAVMKDWDPAFNKKAIQIR